MDKIQKTDRCGQPGCGDQFRPGDIILYRLKAGPNGMVPRPVHLSDLLTNAGSIIEDDTPEPPPAPPASTDPKPQAIGPGHRWWPPVFGRRKSNG